MTLQTHLSLVSAENRQHAHLSASKVATRHVIVHVGCGSAPFLFVSLILWGEMAVLGYLVLCNEYRLDDRVIGV